MKECRLLNRKGGLAKNEFITGLRTPFLSFSDRKIIEADAEVIVLSLLRGD